MINGHGGNIYDMAQQLGCAPSEITDMSSNVNPLGPPPGLAAFLKENMNAIAALPEVDAKNAAYAFAGRYGVDPHLILAGNGTTQFIYTIPLALESKRACILGPTYSDYADACAMHNVSHEFLIAEESFGFKADISQVQKNTEGSDTVFICNPNNPTGVLTPADELEWLCKSRPKTYFIIDESYLPFVKSGDEQSMMGRGLPNVIVLNSMSKIFRVPGLRIGFLVSPENIIERFMRYVLPWSVNSLAQAAVSYLMEQKTETDAFIENTRVFLEAERNRFEEMLMNASGIRLFPSTTSFMLARLFGNHTAQEVFSDLSHDRILIRNCSNFRGLSERFIRISLKTRDVNDVLAEKLLRL
ncbi:pyridoxal phosphate-dependent class II aminotransferase [Desulfococcaceae bacterium HSG8]|nr:pyridoxal phosphate-dependent class II aminotransferase [Desulfococcaceae bacterium HSG8]